MSAAVAARPSQALRQRRESHRPKIATKPTMDSAAVKEEERRYVTTQADILRKFNGRPPSLRVYMYAQHFRINDSQETLPYASPMRELLEHIRQKTVPHNMLEELHDMGTAFYDGCLIVEVHNFKASGVKAKDDTANPAELTANPFSIHNYNNFITPSPYDVHPVLKVNTKPGQPEGQNASSEAKTDKELDKENMPAPGQPASQKQANKAKITTVVLFPTPQSELADITILANTPLQDVATIRRNQAVARAAGNPSTPMTAVPSTPTTLGPGRSPKRQKMVVDENNIHEVQAAFLNAVCPKLFLEPTKSFGETLDLLETHAHPNNQNSPPARKARKRTTAELAADEAEAADMQRYMLAGDEHVTSSSATAAGGDEGKHAVRAGANQQTFSRFKTLAAIRGNHEEAERRKKEEEARQAQAKRQATIDAEAQKRREIEAANHQAEQSAASAASAAMIKKQEALRQQQQHQQQQALAMQMANANAQVSQTPLSATQPQFSSPVVRQQTPMAHAASPLVQTHSTHPMGGTPMVATSSNHAAGSPARPPSAISHHPNAMARTASQQQHQNLSRTGTPQLMPGGTPTMNSAMPARNISSTPTPRMNNQGSPNVPVPGATPIMMQNQPSQSMTPEQMQFLQQQNLQNQLRAQGMQQPTGISPGNPQHLQQLALQRAAMQIQANGVPAGQNPQQYRQMLAHRFFQQLQQSQQVQQSQSMSPDTSQAGTPNSGASQLANMNLQQLKNQYMQRKQQLMQTFGNNIPQNQLMIVRQMEQAITQKEQQLRQQAAAQQQALAQAGQRTMNHGMMQMNMQGGGNQPNSAQMQQYQQMLQQQRAQQQRSNQIMQMRQQAAMQGGQMNMNNMPAGFNVNNMNMGNMPNMGNMGNMGNMNGMNGMNMANMQAMGQGNMGMQGMQGMNMANGMSQQQVQQMMIMRQAQARAAMQQQQQQQQQGQQGGQQGDGSWGGV